MGSKPISPLKFVFVFGMHQFVATWGVAFLAYFLLSTSFGLLMTFDRQLSMRPVYWVLTETPFYPVQISLGFWLGWRLQRRLNHSVMIWVWIIPAIVLAYAVLTNLTLRPWLLPSSNRLDHYFGEACTPRNGCMDQLIITMPLYASLAYSIGAWLRLRTRSAITSAG